MRATVTRAALGALLSALTMLGLIVVASPAQAAAITCTTTAVRVTGGWKVSVRSNHPDPNRVHSYIASYDDNHRFGSITFKPYGPSITIGGHSYYHFRSWQSGTECRPVNVPGTVAGVIQPAAFTIASVTSVASFAGRKTCDTQIQQVTVGGVKKTRLWVTGRPTSTAKVYSFRLTWGWTNTVSTYIPTYRVYDAPRHTPLTKAESWVNGYKCNDWFAGSVF